MTDETRHEHEAGRVDAAIAAAAAKKREQDGEARVGKYGGDDGALEHENAEIEPSERANSKAAPRGKPKA